jgi:hypothetical protein
MNERWFKWNLAVGLVIVVILLLLEWLGVIHIPSR